MIIQGERRVADLDGALENASPTLEPEPLEPVGRHRRCVDADPPESVAEAMPVNPDHVGAIGQNLTTLVDAVVEVAIARKNSERFPDVKSLSVELKSHHEVPNSVLAVERLADLHHQVGAREGHCGRATWQGLGGECERMGPQVGDPVVGIQPGNRQATR